MVKNKRTVLWWPKDLKRTHAGKQAFSDQSQCETCIGIKVMFFDQRSWSSMTQVRVQELLSITNSKLSKKLQNGIEILVGQAVFKLWIKTVKMLFGSITQKRLGLPKFWCCFWVSWTLYYKKHIYIIFSKKCW